MRYAGFISYSRRDEAFAAALERRVQAWRAPGKVRRKTGIARLKLFRDVQDAGLGELSAVLRTGLEASDHLILLCSPAARASDYVAMEIEAFAAMRGPDAIIPVLVDGRPNSEVAPDDPLQDQAFPDALLRLYDEPLAADMRKRPGESRAAARVRDREAFFQIVAKLLGIAKSDELVQRDRRQRRLRLASAAAAVLVTVLAGGAWWWDSRPKKGLDPLWQLTAPAPGPAVSDGLKRLGAALDRDLPAKVSDSRLLVATWNIRNLQHRDTGKTARGPDEYTLIAQVISAFDIVAAQELKGYEARFGPARDALLERLGRHWAYAGTGVTDGPRGNLERLGFFYDTRSVTRTDVLDELVLSPDIMEDAGLERQIARTPVVAEFDVGGHAFRIANTHIVFGRGGPSGQRERELEFDAILRVLSRIIRREPRPTMLVGDLNFVADDVPQVDIAATHGFRFPPGLLAAPSSASVARPRPYDQIVLSWPDHDGPGVTASGVFAIFDHVYRDGDAPLHAARLQANWPDRASDAEEAEKLYLRLFRPFVVSDHFPKWVELDFGTR